MAIPYLRQHCVAGSAEKALDPEILLDPLEEELDLPTGLVDVRDGPRRELEVVGEKHVVLAGLSVPVADPPEQDRALLPALSARERDGLVRGHAAAGGVRTTFPNRVTDSPLEPRHERNPLCVKGFQPAEVLVQTVRDDNAPPRQPQRLRDLDVRRLPIRHTHERRQVAGMVEADVDLDRPLALAVLRPREQREAQVDVGRVQGYEWVLEPESVAGRHAAAAVQKTLELQLEEPREAAPG